MLITFFIILFIAVRSIHFAESFNFSSDQGSFALKAYQIFKDREITLLGPATSLNFEGHQIFQGSIIYYFLLIFLLIGQFDPAAASYIFMIFCSLMIIPLLYGTELLFGRKPAWFMVIIYTAFPYFIDYTKFLWNPNFQLALSPLLILAMGVYRKSNSKVFLFIAGVLSTLILQFHYQFLIVVFAVSVFYFMSLSKKIDLSILFFGFIVGIFPILLFEIRNNFYNSNTLILYFTNLKATASTQNDFENYSHYFLSITLFAFLVLSFFLRNRLTKLRLTGLLLILLLVSLFIYLPAPKSGFRMSENWNYRDEQKTFEIIKSENLRDFRVTNLIYDTQAYVQRYLITKENLDVDFENFSQNKYLFVLADKSKDLNSDPAPEITGIKPFEITKNWQIHGSNYLYLLRRKN